MRRSVFSTLAGLAALLAIAAGETTADTVAVQLLAFNDFHGHLEPPTGSNGRLGDVDAGGAEYLSTHLAALAARNRNTLIVAAGDLIGASPLLSGMFHDEPAVEALNAMGVDVSSVGNHEFDNGWRELLRMQNGGCHPRDGCRDLVPFSGAAYRYLAANVIFDPRITQRSGPVLPAYLIKEIGGVRVGFIGMTLEGTSQLVMAEGIEGLTFEPEVAVANRWARELKRQKVRAIVVLIHEGGIPARDDYNGCAGISGPIVTIAERMSDDIDIIVSGHTHRAYICTIDRKLVTSAAAYGRAITTIDLAIDTRTAEVVSKAARNVIVTRDVPKDPAQTVIIERYRPLYSTVAGRVVGTIAADLTRTPNFAGESILGNIIADGTLEAARAAPHAGADVAFMNPGGIRADLTRGSAEGVEPRPVTYAEAFNVLPFRNRVVVQTMTGRTIKDVLEQQFDNVAPGQDRILQVSRGFTYSYDRTAPRSRRVDRASIMIDGRPLVPAQQYKVAMNEFIATGGDNFSALTRGSAVTTIGLDLDIFAAYFGKRSPVEPPPLNRITRVR
ncbi:MAG: bifunctional metallophosphatase/5'-nucleotidase [Acidobacteria bacterium]|nr:MAG: bifunctional metallophosphatase/5'-nucleotidase [Acidobacteriota bacterium]